MTIEKEKISEVSSTEIPVDTALEEATLPSEKRIAWYRFDGVSMAQGFNLVGSDCSHSRPRSVKSGLSLFFHSCAIRLG